jgi:hypothetical protein
MTKSSKAKANSTQGGIHVSALCIVALVLLSITMSTSTVSAQQVPPRTYQLQLYKMIAPEPPSNAERVKLDVLRATNPYTGTIDTRVLRAPNVGIRSWMGPGVGVPGQAMATPSTGIRPWPETGRSVPGQAVPTPGVGVRSWP